MRFYLIKNVPLLGLKDIDGQLGPYPFESLKIWYSLTNHITEILMKRFVMSNNSLDLSLHDCECHNFKQQWQNIPLWLIWLQKN